MLNSAEERTGSRLTSEDRDTDEQRAFRLRAREYMAGCLPPRIPGEPANAFENLELVAKDKRIQRMLWDGGFAGITVLDGSFLRIENASITANQGSGIIADRGAILKVFATPVTNNAADGMFVRNSTLQLSPQYGLPAPVTGNLGAGLVLRSLSFAAFSGTLSGNGGAFPNGVDCKPGAALRASAAIRSASSPNCGVE